MLSTTTIRIESVQGDNADRDETVRIATLKYKAGATDLLSVLQLQTDQIATQEELIKARNAQLANRINLHLALGGSFDKSPAAAPPNLTSIGFQTPLMFSGRQRQIGVNPIVVSTNEIDGHLVD